LGEVSIGSARGQRSGKRLSLRHCHTILPGPSFGYPCPPLSVIPARSPHVRARSSRPHTWYTHIPPSLSLSLSLSFLFLFVSPVFFPSLLSIFLDPLLRPDHPLFAFLNARSFYLRALGAFPLFVSLPFSLLSLAFARARSLAEQPSSLFPSLDFIPYERAGLT